VKRTNYFHKKSHNYGRLLTSFTHTTHKRLGLRQVLSHSVLVQKKSRVE